MPDAILRQAGQDMMTDIRFRRTRADDRGFVWNLNVACFQDVVTRQFGEWDEAWQIANFEKHWNPERFDIVLREAVPVGIRSFWQEEDALFLSQVLVHPDYQNQGIGTFVLRDVMAVARDAGLPVRLRALTKNSRAMALYRRLGFEAFETTDIYHLMRWKGQPRARRAGQMESD